MGHRQKFSLFNFYAALDTLCFFSYALVVFNPFKIFFGQSKNELEENELNVMSPDMGPMGAGIAPPIKEPMSPEGLIGDSIPANHPPEKSAENSNEPIKKETIDEIGHVMTNLPRLSEGVAFNIPYRTERTTPIEVYDDVTGLMVQAVYKPDSSLHSNLRNPAGLTIILSSPEFKKGEDNKDRFGKMSEALRQIYGESEDLDRQIQNDEFLATYERSDYNRAKFKLTADTDWIILSNSALIEGKEDVPLDASISSGRSITESGGQFLKEIIERVARKQQEDYEQIKVRTDLAIEKVRDQSIPNDLERAYQYAYHSTDRINIPGISESGLQPSGSGSKEPGTIFFTGWDSASSVLNIDQKNSVTYRFKITNMPTIAKEWHIAENPELRDPGLSIPTRAPIPREKLDFSLDSGQTWMPVMSRRPTDLPKAA